MDIRKEKLIALIGQEAVFDDLELRESYATDQSFMSGNTPGFIVKPTNADQVQKLVKWANETCVPLVPISSGPPHFKGDTVPSVAGAVIVDLSGMKKIISINRQHRMAIVEPGVTYEELQEALLKEGMTLSTSLSPRATKSVLASVLEVEPRINANHQWMYMDPLRCVEVTWGDGNTIYTGEAGGSARDLEKQWAVEKWQVNGMGPMMLDFHRLLTSAQGSMGIVTWVSLKCEILPQIHKMYFVPAEDSESLHDFMYKVLKLRFSDELMVMNGHYLATLLGNSPTQIIESKQKLPAWVALVGVAGRDMLPEIRVSAQEQDISDIAEEFGLKMTPELNGIDGTTMLEKVIRPSCENYWKETYKGAFQDIFFVTTLDRTSEFIGAMKLIAEKAGYPGEDIGVYIQPQHCGTSYHLEFSLPYDPENPAEVTKVKALFTKASEELSTRGAYFARPYGIWAKLQFDKDPQAALMLNKLKDIFDPNNIMNPGKLSK